MLSEEFQCHVDAMMTHDTIVMISEDDELICCYRKKGGWSRGLRASWTG
jgi:hypothetical protein